MAKSDSLRKAKKSKNDEFYTRLEDIETEISSHPDYVRHFKGKTVLCNCDDPEWSAFYVFFRLHFNQLGLKKLITTHYNKDGSSSYKLEWEGEKLGMDTVNMIKTPLQGDGDFRSEECIELLKEADIVVTNPPFSIAREYYIPLLFKYNKQFVIIGDLNWVTYKNVFPLIKENKMWFGYKNVKEFKTPDGSIQKFGNKLWFTNLDLDKNHENFPLTRNYKGNENNYPKYDNYDAIEVGRVSNIPKDYYGDMGVPITFLASFCPDQFEIIGISKTPIGNHLRTQIYEKQIQYSMKNGKEKLSNVTKLNDGAALLFDKKPEKYPHYEVDGKYYIAVYPRILIRKK